MSSGAKKTTFNKEGADWVKSKVQGSSNHYGFSQTRLITVRGFTRGPFQELRLTVTHRRSAFSAEPCLSSAEV